jgi:hypothetical protein
MSLPHMSIMICTCKAELRVENIIVTGLFYLVTICQLLVLWTDNVLFVKSCVGHVSSSDWEVSWLSLRWSEETIEICNLTTISWQRFISGSFWIWNRNLLHQIFLWFLLTLDILLFSENARMWKSHIMSPHAQPNTTHSTLWTTT